MKLVIEAEKLAEALSALARVIQSAANSATYQCVLIVVKADRMYLRGTDLMSYVERTLKVTADGDGAWLAVYDTLFHYAKTSHGPLKMTFNDNNITLKTKSDGASIKLRDAKEYTRWPVWSELTPINCKGDALVDAISQATVSASVTLLKPVLHSVSVKGRDVQSANGFRYQVIRYAEKNSKSNLLIPYTSCLKVGAVARPVKEVAAKENMLGIRSRGETNFFSLNASESEYPVFRDFELPKFVYEAKVRTNDLDEVIEKLKGFVDKDYRLVTLTTKADALVFAVDAPDKGSYAGQIAVKAKGKVGLAMSFDLLDLTTFLGQLTKPGKYFLLRLSSAETAYQLVDPSQNDFLYVSFPLTKEKQEKPKDAE